MNQSESIINVVGKIMQVSREIGAIQKKQMSGGGESKQKYFAIEDVMAAVSDAMDRAGLWIVPACTGVDVSEVALVYHFSFMIVDKDSGEYMNAYSHRVVHQVLINGAMRLKHSHSRRLKTRRAGLLTRMLTKTSC